MKEIIGDDYPTYEDSVNESLKERLRQKQSFIDDRQKEQESAHTYEDSINKFYENKLTEINKQLDLLKENSDLEQNNFKLKKKFAKLKKKFAHSQNKQSLKDGIHKDNLKRLMQENLELRHRLDCIADDIEFIERHIASYKKSRKWFKQPSTNADGSIYADQAWHHVTNIQIACDLTDDAPLEWDSGVMRDSELDNLNRDL